MSLKQRLFSGGLIITASFITGQTGASYAQSTLPNDVPTPLARPFAPAAKHESPINLVTPKARPAAPDPLITSSFSRVENPAAISGTLKSGLDALYSRDVVGAIAYRNGMTKGSLDRQILTWAIATSGLDGVSSAEIAAATLELPGWPGMSALRRNSERALSRENATASTVIATFGNTKPQTTDGMMALARAYVETGNKVKAHQLLAPWWAKERLSAEDEGKVLKEFSNILTREDHQRRLLRSLYNDRLQSAKLLSGPAQAQSLYKAFAALAAKSPNTAKSIADVDRSWHSNAIYTFLQIRYLRRAERFDEATALMLKAPKDAASLGDPDAWWVERRILSRELLDINKPQLAYKLVTAHAAESPTMAAEAEFHAGWYALRALKQPKLAAPHFAKIAEISSRPVSASRAYYWLGRAADAGSGGDAVNYYRRSAHFGTTFYGQLSAARLQEKAPELAYPKPSDAERVRFSGRPAVHAIRRLEQIGYGNRATTLYTQLSQELNSVGELALLAVMAEKNENHYLALRVGKNAAFRGLDVGALSHPIGAIPAHANISGSGKALAYAIARQESEFNIGAVSKAGARGLLQLMPTTAKSVATRNGMPFSEQKLTNDAAYNATLGAHFLGEQLDRFNGSYVLTFAGYNAGPRRASDWVEKYGDPRGKSIEDVVDWIERIPYSETRNYVQRVMENYEVYKARLTGSADIRSDLIYGRR
ncbi:lytic transglycosylase domain-containing protein [Ochrobactrum sp. Marseille-Q0166]|uniref:lytic transglycosylase domain-containing protein n=1 Tax=Ochrobactrum sp. Marseille-Q0166 TaxID=2761105 RepID=UPI001655018A|nr:lytic transglycosylase domain-containing protein [Ochrobactrum sp. Marseille-Q0166]MBC8717794.1 lytic transglycosylase domain-containing protein [Ochrobactrum sp. Marseille-Q0166]